MASLMLSVGDYQMTVAPIPVQIGAAPELQSVFAEMPDDHPLKAGDHCVTCYESDNVASCIVGEQEALTLVAAWLSLDSDLETEASRKLLIAAFGAEIKGWMFP